MMSLTLARSGLPGLRLSELKTPLQRPQAYITLVAAQLQARKLRFYFFIQTGFSMDPRTKYCFANLSEFNGGLTRSGYHYARKDALRVKNNRRRRFGEITRFHINLVAPPSSCIAKCWHSDGLDYFIVAKTILEWAVRRI